jgi:hypothetical protein
MGVLRHRPTIRLADAGERGFPRREGGVMLCPGRKLKVFAGTLVEGDGRSRLGLAFRFPQAAAQTGVFVLQMLNLKVGAVEPIFEHPRLIDQKSLVDGVLFAGRSATRQKEQAEHYRTNLNPVFHP